jgi:Raf kinase inhibitor-like YbhB/YbcL family protein
MRTFLVNALVAFMVLVVGADKLAAQQPPAPQPSQFKMTIPAYSDEDWMPLQLTCGTADAASPRVQWTDTPQGTMSLALVFHDMDAAPGKGAMDVTHWVLWNIPATSTQLPAGVQPDSSPDGIQQGKNTRGVNGYLPPCPPVGVRPHHYIFELYALDTKLDLQAGANRADLLKAIDGHVIGKSSFVGIFGQGIDEKAWRWGTAKLPERPNE